MLINRESIATIVKGLNTTFKEVMGAYGREQDDVYLRFEDMGMVVPSTSAVEEHVMLEDVPGFREWLGERVIQNLEATPWLVRNKKFEKTIGLKKEDIEDGKLGAVTMAIQNMAADAALLKYDQGVSALTTNDTWADGSNFYLANRTFGANTIKNLLSGSSAGVLNQTNFDIAVALMQSYLSKADKALGVRPTLLVVGPSLRATAWNIVKNELISSSSAAIKNPNFNLVGLKVCPEITGSSWYLMGRHRMIQPITYQERIPVQMQNNYNDSADWNSDQQFMRDEILFGGRARGRAIKTAPHLIIKGDGT